MPRAAIHRIAAPSVRAPAHVDAQVARDVRRGLTRDKKMLPPWLFYDDEGSRLYEEITKLAEYYPTRTERAILEANAEAIVERVAAGASTVHALELGAGTGEKSQIVARAIARRQSRATFVPCDVSAAPLAILRARFAREAPEVRVRTVVGHHDAACAALRALPNAQLAMFLGSSIGNYEGDDAIDLLARIRRSVRAGAALLLGTDVRKSADVLVPAYDDADGVTAAFNKNVLVRINRELGGTFVLDRFRHVAVWNDAASRIEMHLQSTIDQLVAIDALDLEVRFRRGERIHTESSVKYDDASVDAMLGAAGFVREQTFRDERALFAVHVARAAT
jgi:dimethylhistidine N-methyltransferase